MNAEPPVVDGRYRVLSRVGSGGMADVYLAEDLQLGRQVALKLLHRRFAEDQEFVERFRREAQSAAGLSHPNVVAVFDRGEWDGTYYIAMEFLPGRSLKTIVREHGALEPGTAIDIVLQILRAARFAHQRGIIHRDLKPHNVILDGEGRVRVTDFGIARAGASDMTQTGSIMGTAQYLSPEQAQGQPVSEASDLYSIGIVLYELLTGVLPFDGETAVSIALKQVSQQPSAPSALNPAVTPALDAIVLCALAKDPAQRFANADQFTAALTQARAGYAPDAGATARLAPAGLPVLAAGMTAGHALGPPTTGSWLAPPTAATMYAPPSAYQVTGERPALYEPPPKQTWRWWVFAAVTVVVIAAIGVYLLLRPRQATVPALAPCETQLAATAMMMEAHLVAQTVTQISNDCPPGRVLSVTPPPGSVLQRGSGVTLAIAQGISLHRVPSVVNQPVNQALPALQQAGFTPVIMRQTSADVPNGVVISTSPEGGTRARPNSQVQVVVSTGPAQVTVPSLEGRTEVSAGDALKSAGLSVGQVTTQPSTTAEAGTVIAQSAPPGSTLAEGATVDLVLAGAPATVTVPDALGVGEVQAAAALGSAGFQVAPKTRAVSDPIEDGIVLAQQPRPGRMERHGSTVVLTIGMLTTTTTTTTTPTTTTTTPTTTTPTTTTTTTTPTTPTTTTPTTTTTTPVVPPPPTTTTTTTAVPPPSGVTGPPVG